MKLTEAFYCPECDEVFKFQRTKGICPSCTNKYNVALQMIWFSSKEVTNEEINKTHRVYVTPVRYDECHQSSTEINNSGETLAK